MQLEGSIYKIYEIKILSEKFKKREFIVKVDSKYPQYIKFEINNENCNKLDSYKIGDGVIVDFDIRGKEWTNPKTGEIMYFNSLSVWKIEKSGIIIPTSPSLTSTPEAEEDNLDLPF